MPQPFSNTLRSVEALNLRFWMIILGIAVPLAAAWAVWFAAASVPIYEVSQSARLEVNDSVSPVQAPVSGRIRKISAVLGQEVAAGDILIELDAAAETADWREQNARIAAIQPQFDRLGAELAMLERSAREAEAAAQASRQAAAARVTDAEVAAAMAFDTEDRQRRLHEEGLVSEAERVRAAKETERARAVLEMHKRERDRDWLTHRANAAEARVRVERLRRELADLQGQSQTNLEAADGLQHAISLRVLRAPIAGRIGQLADVHVHEFVSAGDHLAAIVPPGRLRAVAQFSPSAALGRVRRGQSGHLRLDGFPWTQYGSLPVIVEEVADEARAQQIRVVLTVNPETGSRLPIRHGLPGAAVIEIEHATPAALVLRAAGHWLGVTAVNRTDGSGPP